MSAFHHQKLKANEDRKPRKCLTCREDFDSRWIGERVCPKCKGNEAWRDGDVGEDYRVARS